MFSGDGLCSFCLSLPYLNTCLHSGRTEGKCIKQVTKINGQAKKMATYSVPTLPLVFMFLAYAPREQGCFLWGWVVLLIWTTDHLACTTTILLCSIRIMNVLPSEGPRFSLWHLQVELMNLQPETLETHCQPVSTE